MQRDAYARLVSSFKLPGLDVEELRCLGHRDLFPTGQLRVQDLLPRINLLSVFLLLDAFLDPVGISDPPRFTIAVSNDGFRPELIAVSSDPCDVALFDMERHEAAVFGVLQRGVFVCGAARESRPPGGLGDAAIGRGGM